MSGPRALTQEPLAGVPVRPLWTRFWPLVPVLVIAALLGARALLHDEPLDRLAISDQREKADPPETVVRTGSLYIARGGPVVVGYWAATDAYLRVGDRAMHGRGMVKQRIILPAGPVAIHFASTGYAKLMWNPVGRRGDPEYVPPSSLSPEPPDRATFDAPGVSRLDGIIALALLLTIIGAVCFAARRKLAAVPTSTWIAMGAVFAGAVAVRWIDLSGFGETWDEGVNWTAGRNYVTNLLSLDFSAPAWQWNYEHPPVMKVLEGIGGQLTDGYTAARMLSSIWTALGCAFLVPIGARLFRPRVGVLAGVIAALLPPLVAHGQIVGHESPTVLWWCLGLLLALGVHDYLSPDDRAAVRALRWRLAAVGVVVGIAIASRFVNGFLGPLCALIVVVQAPPRWRRETLVWGAVLMPLAAIVTVYAIWPRLWMHPIQALTDSFRKLDVGHADEPFLGTITNHPAPYYFIPYLFCTLPLGALLGVIAGAVRGIRERSRAWLIALAWFIAPLGAALSPVRQDGVRYVMPCVVAFALIAAAGFDQLAIWARWRHAFIALAAALALYLGITLLRIHPYYLDYFNEPVGGAGGVASRRWFETAWWGEGVDRGVAFINAHAEPNARVSRDCVLPGHLTWFRDDLWNTIVPNEQATWILVYSPSTFPCRIPKGAQRAYALVVDGVDFAVVYKRDLPPPPAKPTPASSPGPSPGPKP